MAVKGNIQIIKADSWCETNRLFYIVVIVRAIVKKLLKICFIPVDGKSNSLFEGIIGVITQKIFCLADIRITVFDVTGCIQAYRQDKRSQVLFLSRHQQDTLPFCEVRKEGHMQQPSDLRPLFS